jgi:hypothetical protein
MKRTPANAGVFHYGNPNRIRINQNLVYTRHSSPVTRHSSRMDRALWISWYNLPPERRDEYLSWAHHTYIPRVLKRAGILWGAHYASEENVVPLGGGKGRVSHARPEAVPAGDRYILIFGARDSGAFADPSPRRFHAQLPGADRAMLALRAGERMNVMLEESRVYGPEAKLPESDREPAPCIQLGSFNSGAPEDEDELAAWYAQWRLPSLRNLPGVVRVRKLVSVSGWAKHACCYEFTSVEARNEHFVYYERDRPDMEEWSKRAVKNLVHAPGSPNLARRIYLTVKP